MPEHVEFLLRFLYNATMNNKGRFRLWDYLRPNKGSLFLACFAIMAECGLEISIPFLMNLLLSNGMDRYEKDGEVLYTLHLDFVLLIGGIMVAFALLALVLGIITARFTARTGRALGYELRKAEYRKIQAFSFRNIDGFRTNSLVTRLTNDIQILSDTFCQVLRPLLRAPIQLIFALAFAITMSARLSVVFAVILPVMAGLLIFMAIRARPRFIMVQKALDDINRDTQESLIAMRLIRANDKAGYENEKFAKVNRNLASASKRSLGFIAYNQAIMQFMTYSCTIGILLVGGNLALTAKDADFINDMASFLSYVAQLLASLNMVSNVFMSFTRSEASLSRVKEVMETESEIKDTGDSENIVENGSISFQNVSFRYGKSEKSAVLKDVSFDIPSGAFAGIIGQTGSSKSTLIYLLERFYDVDEGRILVSRKDIRQYRLAHLRESIAIAFQSPRLFSGTVRDNLLWGNPKATDADLWDALDICCSKDFVADKLPFGLDTPIGQSGTNVSGGQRQRLCIARALLRKPKILILDDSFSALDRITEGRLKENLRTRLPDMTKIVIAQKVSTIKDADTIIVLNEGRVDGIGKNDDLLKENRIYQDIYRLQEEGKECLPA